MTDRVILTTRLVDVPRETVFDAFANPGRLSQWWGPAGFTNTIGEFDLRLGGAWRLVMHSPDGVDYHNVAEFVEVIAPDRIVFRHLEPIHQFDMTMTFKEEGGKTRLTWRMVFEPDENFAAIRDFIVAANEQNFDRLEAHLKTSAREIYTTRLINAPRERVWDAWTDPAQVAQWWGPNGFTNTIKKMDLREGGEWTHLMHGPDGTDYPCHFVFAEVRRPDRLVYDNPAEPKFKSIVTFDDADGKTRVIMRLVLESAEARAMVVEKVGAIEGGRQTVARLAAFVEPPAAPPAIEDESLRSIVTTRLVDAPRELVWRAWTEPDRLAQWWGPEGFASTIQKMDVRPGGEWILVMHGPDGTDYFNKSIYTTVRQPELIAYDHVSGPLFTAQATFEDEAGKTRITLRMLFESAEMRNRVADKYGAAEGAKQTLDRLAELLKREPST